MVKYSKLCITADVNSGYQFALVLGGADGTAPATKPELFNSKGELCPESSHNVPPVTFFKRSVM